MSEEEPQGLTGTVVRGAGLAAAGFAMAQVLTLGFYLALARLATPQDFGQLAAASIVIGVGLLFTESGMLAALIHRRDRLEEAASTAVVATFAAGILFTLLGVAVAPLVGLYFDSHEVALVSAAMSGLFLLRTIPIVPEALLQRRFSFLRRMVVEPAGALAFGTAAVIATSNGMGVWGLVIGHYASGVTDVVLSWALVRWRPRFRLASFKMWRELVAYGRHVVAATVVLRVGEQVPTALLGRFVGTGQLGQYRYADRLSSTPYSAILAAASYVLFPAFARISGSKDRFHAAFLRSLRWTAALAFPMGMIFLPLGVALAVELFGEVWRDAGHAVVAMCLFTAVSPLISIATEAFKADGRPELLTRVHTVTAISAAVAMAALLPFGLVGVAAGLSFGALLGAAYSIRLVHTKVGVSLRRMLAEIWPPAVAALVMAGALFPLEHLLVHADGRAPLLGLALLAGEGLVGACIYLATLVILAPDTGRELVRGIRGLRRRLRRGDSAPPQADVEASPPPTGEPG